MPRVQLKKIDYSLSDFSHWVTDRRKEQHITLDQLGQRFGISGQRMGQKIKTNNFTMKEFLQLCDMFHPDPDDMKRFVNY